MNKIYRLVWNHVQSFFIAISKITKTNDRGATVNGKGAPGKPLYQALMIGLTLFSFNAFGGYEVNGNASGTSIAIGGAENEPATATGSYSTAVGTNSAASGRLSAAFGDNANATGEESTAVGAAAKAAGGQSLAVGRSAQALKASSMAIGMSAEADNDFATAIGYSARASGNNTLAFGTLASAQKTSAIAIGTNAQAHAVRSITIGNNSVSSVEDGVAIGTTSVANTQAGQQPYIVSKASPEDKNRILNTKGTGGGVSFGRNKEAGGQVIYRQLTNVAAGNYDTDAVNVAQLKSVESLFSEDGNFATLAVGRGADNGLAFTGKTGLALNDKSGNTLDLTATGIVAHDAQGKEIEAKLVTLSADAGAAKTGTRFALRGGKAAQFASSQSAFSGENVATYINGDGAVSVGIAKAPRFDHIAIGEAGKPGAISLDPQDGLQVAGFDGKSAVTVKGDVGMTVVGGGGKTTYGSSGFSVRGPDRDGKPGEVLASLTGSDGLVINDKQGRVTLNGSDGLRIQGPAGRDGKPGSSTTVTADGGIAARDADGKEIEAKLVTLSADAGAAKTGTRFALRAGKAAQFAPSQSAFSGENVATYINGDGAVSVGIAKAPRFDRIVVGSSGKSGAITLEPSKGVTINDRNGGEGVSINGDDGIKVGKVKIDRDSITVNSHKVLTTESFVRELESTKGGGLVTALNSKIDKAKSAAVHESKNYTDDKFNAIKGATTDEYRKISSGQKGITRFNGDYKEPSATGNNTLAIGSNASAAAENSTAIGTNARASGKNSVAVGNNSVAERDNVFSVGTAHNNRQITHVAAGTKDNDAVNVQQFRNESARVNNQLGELKKGIWQNRKAIHKLDGKVNKGLASQAALNGLLQPYGVGKFSLTAAVGGYESEQAIAVGTGYRFNEKIAVKSGIAANAGSISGATYNVGIIMEW